MTNNKLVPRATWKCNIFNPLKIMKNSDTLLFFYAHENEHMLELLVMVFNQNRENLLESVTLSNNCGI